jgi:hypothetical protein
MGWTSTRKHYPTAIEAVMDLDWVSKLEIVAHSETRDNDGRVVYMARHARNRPGHVEAWVYLVETDAERTRVKAMHEGEGPYYYDAGPRVLAVLTPTDEASAMEWRATCREARKARRAR